MKSPNASPRISPLLRSGALIAFLALFLLGGCGRQQPSDAVDVGLAKIDITPDYPIRLNGYGNRSEETAEVATRLHARAIAIGSDADGLKLILTVDNCAVTGPIVTRVFDKLKNRVELVRENLVISSTHTHAAPVLTGSIPAIFGKDMPPEHQSRVDRYTDELVDKLVTVALEAAANRAPSLLSWNRGEVGFGGNRREMKDGKWVSFDGNPNGPVDHRLPVLFVHSASGQLRGVFTNYACHCTTTGGKDNRMHADWAGFAAERLEASHANAVALVAIGCGADQNPNPRGELSMSQDHGLALAAEVERLLAQPSRPLPASLDARLSQIDLPLDPLPTRAAYEAIAKGDDAREAYFAQRQLDKMARGELKDHVENYPVAVWNFGDELAMVFLGGEVVVDYALRLYQEFDKDRLWVNAYSNDVPCYIPSRRILKEGGYEADRSMNYYDKPTRFSPAVEDLIIDTVQRLMPHSFYAEAKRAAFPLAAEPADAIATFSLHEDMQIQLVASEPQIIDPVAIEFGPDGRLWVLEQPDYPLGMDDELRFGGRVSVLEDKDGNGHYETSQVFADKLPFPTGIKLWRDGIVVCAAPEILYLRDTDGDGRADERKVLMSGFPTFNYHARVNSPRWGLDNWIYFANGLAAREVSNDMRGERLNISKRDFRMNIDTGAVEAVSGLAQFGRTRDDWGNWFGVHNSYSLFHYPLNERYVQRNPDFTPPDPKVYVPNDEGQQASVFSVGKGTYRATRADHSDRITSACGSEIYRDTLLGEAFYGNSFVCEPAHNLITRRVLDPRGSSFVGKRAKEEEHSEFLASTDNWFRPVQARTGPDGALWVVDMYRWIIEHPDYMPPDRLRLLNVREGSQRGRIYRVFPKSAAPRPAMRLSSAESVELAAALDSPNGVVRDTAHQLLVERGDPKASLVLQSVLRNSPFPQSRIQALATLHGIGALDPSIILLALGDANAQARRHGVRIAEGHWTESEEIAAAVLKLSQDDDPQLAMQLAYSLGEWDDPRAGRALGDIVLKHGSDAYIQTAVMSSVRPHLPQLIESVLSSDDPELQARYAPALTEAAVAGKDWKSLSRLISETRHRHPSLAFQVGTAAHEALRNQKLDATALRRNEASSELAQALDQLQQLQANAWKTVEDQQAETAPRRAAISCLAAPRKLSSDEIARLARGLNDPNGRIQEAIVDALGALSDDGVARELLNRWPTYTPNLRARVSERFIARSSWASLLLERMSQEPALATALGASFKERLLNHPSRPIREQAQAAFGDIAAARESVIAQYEAVKQLSGNPERGASVYTQTCASCHNSTRAMPAIGPDLNELTDRSIQAMLIAILDPNRILDPKYESFTATLTDGRVISGRLVDETASQVGMMGMDGVAHQLRRSEIASLASSGRSLMPEGLEAALPLEKMADLVAYLKDLGPRPKSIPGNQPQIVTADAIGTLHLEASSSEIYGERVTYASDRDLIVDFDGAQDRVLWRLDAPQAGRYSVELEWASNTPQPWNSFRISSIAHHTDIPTPSTGSWESFRRQYIGYLELDAGSEIVTLEPVGELKGELMRLKSIRLIYAPQRPRRPSNPDEVVK